GPGVRPHQSNGRRHGAFVPHGRGGPGEPPLLLRAAVAERGSTPKARGGASEASQRTSAPTSAFGGGTRRVPAVSGRALAWLAWETDPDSGCVPHDRREWGKVPQPGRSGGWGRGSRSSAAGDRFLCFRRECVGVPGLQEALRETDGTR